MLVLEDDEDGAEILERWLTFGGYRPLVYRDGEALLADVEGQALAIAAVLDVYLGAGRMTGIEVGDALRRRAPHVRVVLITGRDPSEALQARYHVVAKPFPAEAVLAAIADRGNGR